MVLLLSPAKNMRSAAAPAGVEVTRPAFLEQTARLAALLRVQSAWQLESLLGISPELALRALAMYQTLDLSQPGSPAAASYYGLAYRHLEAGSFSSADWAWAQGHLRIASAFYGLLRPADGIVPHRLDFANRLRAEGGTLYRFWGGQIAAGVFACDPVAVDLASAEYARCVAPWAGPGQRVVKVEFLLHRRGKLVTLPTEAKMCRGAMARWAVLNRLEAPEQLCGFTEMGYRFAPRPSGADRLVFIKTEEE